MTVNPASILPDGSPVPPYAIHSGDYIRVDDGGHQITAHVVGVEHGPGHEDGGGGVDWEQAFPEAGNPPLHHGHIEFTARDAVLRVWAAQVHGDAA